MNWDRCQDEDGSTSNPKKEVAPPTSDEARTMLYDAVAALGQDVCGRWVQSGWLDREVALRRIQQGESPDAVARDVTR